jgi:hypothetical protein
MNKAFVREPDQTGPAKCPRCGSLGTTVGAQTLDAWLSPGARRMLPVITVDEVDRPVYPKDPSAPMCGCFGFTLDDIEADLAEGGVTRTKALVARAKTSEAQCATQSPDGRSCVGEVQRCYMRMKG